MTEWRTDPALAGKFHPQYPDDVQVLVHDGDPRRTQRRPELCWVRLAAVDRPGVYVGVLLNQPHQLQTVKQGDRLRFVANAGMKNPLHVTDAYLRERADWTITPCDKCGASECFDPPTVMAKVRFPQMTDEMQIRAFTSFCSLCGGVQQLQQH